MKLNTYVNFAGKFYLLAVVAHILQWIRCGMGWGISSD
jgi:hypothetical protein